MDDEFARDENIRAAFKTGNRIAIVGLSGKEDRPSFQVARYLMNKGYEIIPINPNENEILGAKSYPDLTSIPFSVDVVDVFRKADVVEPVVNEAIKIGAKIIWFQEGVINFAAAEKAKQAGLKVVMDRCMLKEHVRLNRK